MRLVRPFILMIAVAAGATAIVLARGGQATLDTAAIAQGLGVSGQLQGDVYRVGLPRTDLSVTVHGIAIKPGLALGSWAAFKRAGTQAVVDGDLVLLDAEVNPVISKLEDGGFQITAVHNHLLDESPHLMYVHYWGQGGEDQLARSLRTALAASKTPLTAAPAAPAAAPDNAGFDADAFQKALGRTGAVKGGVLSLSIPRPERITMMGVELPPSMGMATSINVQAAGGGKVAATGDFVMLDDEVNPIVKALRSHGIAVTALHNHMMRGTPMLYFMHFWAEDAPANVAAGLKAATALLAK